MLKTYYALTKPGIIYGNAITATAGFFLAAQGQFSLSLFIVMLLGLSLIIASACVFNNYLDRDIDGLMARTKQRALVKKEIDENHALMFATILGVLGTFLLAAFTNFLTLAAALVGFFVYVVVYGVWKRRSVYGTLIGSVAGAAPPVVGYCAVTNRFDAGALILFLAVALWQMPHFYAIAMYRADEYAAASIPVLPLKKDMQTTKAHILIYIVTFAIVASLLTAYGYTGYTYLTVVMLLGLIWLGLGIKKFKTSTDVLWGRQMFLFSLIVITTFSITLFANAILP